MAELMCLYAELAAYLKASPDTESVGVILWGYDVSYDGAAYHWMPLWEAT